MKKLALALLLLAAVTSCKKDPEPTPTPEPYKCPTCVGTPEAKAAYDGNSGGVYKGVLVGSTGTVALYLYNTGTEIKALVNFDGKSATLTTTELSGWMPGQAINGAKFTGTIDGKAIEMKFTVGTNGQNPLVNFTLIGHTIVASVFKETSTSLIKNYEGTYDGTSTGTFNMAFHGSEYSIVSSGGGGAMVGVLVNGKIDFANSSVQIKGEFNGDDVSGTWQDADEPAKKGTWTGKRTM